MTGSAKQSILSYWLTVARWIASLALAMTATALDRFAGGTKSRGALMELLCALNPPDLELLQRASHLSHELGATKN